MSENLRKTTVDHKQLYQDLVKLIDNYSQDMTSAEMLAVASNLLGKLVAMQDQRTMSRDMAMEIIINNLELGNQQVLEQLERSRGHA